MTGIDADQVPQFQELFLDRMRSRHQEVLDRLGSGELDVAACNVIERTAVEVCKSLSRI